MPLRNHYVKCDNILIIKMNKQKSFQVTGRKHIIYDQIYPK